MKTLQLVLIFSSFLATSLVAQNDTTKLAQNDTSKVQKLYNEEYEYVNVGYEKKLRSRELGAISVITKEDIMSGVNTGLQTALQGRAPGVYVSSSGQPGMDVIVSIRGSRGIITGSEPLYVLDDMPIDGKYVELLNPNDIARIDILKDAASCAIYGSRGSNGVILITTKRGKN